MTKEPTPPESPATTDPTAAAEKIGPTASDCATQSMVVSWPLARRPGSLDMHTAARRSDNRPHPDPRLLAIPFNVVRVPPAYGMRFWPSRVSGCASEPLDLSQPAGHLVPTRENAAHQHPHPACASSCASGSARKSAHVSALSLPRTVTEGTPMMRPTRFRSVFRVLLSLCVLSAALSVVAINQGFGPIAGRAHQTSQAEDLRPRLEDG